MTALRWAGLAFLVGMGLGCDNPLMPVLTRLRFENGSSMVVDQFYASPCEEPLWGPNWLDHPQAPHTYRDWIITPGCYDVLMVSTSGDIAWITRESTIPSGHFYRYFAYDPEP